MNWHSDLAAKLLEAAQSAQVAGYSGFAEYLRLREGGLRKAAIETLMRFVAEVRSWRFEERRRFVVWHLHLFHQTNSIPEIRPFPLLKFVIQPTMQEWRDNAPHDLEVLRWSDNEDELARTIADHPNDLICLERLTAMTLKGIDYATHELPCGYCGDDPSGDLSKVQTLLGAIGHCASAASLNAWRDEALKQRDLIQSYVDYSKEPRQEDFRTWAIRENRPFSSGNWGPPIYYNA